MSNSTKIPSITLIQKEVCAHLGLEGVDLCGKDRHRSLAYARSLAMYLSRTLTPKSLVEIGKDFGGRDHTTVLHNCQKIREKLRVVVGVQRDVSLIRKSLEAKLVYEVKECSKSYFRACQLGETNHSCCDGVKSSSF